MLLRNRHTPDFAAEGFIEVPIPGEGPSGDGQSAATKKWLHGVAKPTMANHLRCGPLSYKVLCEMRKDEVLDEREAAGDQRILNV